MSVRFVVKLIPNKLTLMKERMLSIDVLRGMTIFMMIIVNTPGSWAYVWSPLKHADWHGCTPTDLVFPSFLFVIGLSMAFSFRTSTDSELNSKELLLKILKRAALIFLVGLLLNWFPFYYKHISNLRIFGVLQRIALAYLLAGFLIVLLKKNSRLLLAAAGLLLLHWLILVSFGSSDPFSLEGNISKDVDLFFFGETHIYKGFGIRFDPEGLLGTLSSGAHILIGLLLARTYLIGKKISIKTVRDLGLVSLGLIISGLLLSLFYPINKPLWTGSYVLYTSGISGALLSLLVWSIDIHKFRVWIYPFRVFGLNPLFSFLLSILFVKIFLYIFKFESGNLYSILFKNVFQPAFGNYLGSFLFALTFTMMIWSFSFLLFRKGKVIKL